MKTSVRRKKAICALGVLISVGAALVVFVVAAEEQAIISSGDRVTHTISLQELATRGAGSNKHIQLADFYVGKRYIYRAKLVQFRDVYLPLFAKDGPETGDHLQVLLWVRNDRHSNQRFIESPQDLEQFVAEFNRHPRGIKGVLRRPTDRVRALAMEAYPGTNSDALQVLWAREFPETQSVNLLWFGVVLCLGAAGVCGIAYRRMSRIPQN